MSERPTTPELPKKSNELLHPVYFSKEQYDNLIEETELAVENLQTYGIPDIEQTEYNGFRLPSSSYHFGRLSITSNPEGTTARLALAGPNNTRVAFLLSNEDGVWTNEDANSADLLLNEDVVRLFDRETNHPIFDTALGERGPDNSYVLACLKTYAALPESKATIVHKQIYRSAQPFSDHNQSHSRLTADARSQLMIKTTVTPPDNESPKHSTKTEVSLERGDQLAVGSEAANRKYRLYYSSDGEAYADLAVVSTAPELQELVAPNLRLLPEAAAKRAAAQMADDAQHALNEAVRALDTTTYN